MVESVDVLMPPIVSAVMTSRIPRLGYSAKMFRAHGAPCTLHDERAGQGVGQGAGCKVLSGNQLGTICRMDPTRLLLRHTVATVAYRGGKAVRGAPPSFADFRAGERTRTPVQILAHVGDLFDWGLSIAKGAQAWHNSTPLPWDEEVARFFATLERFDAYLASDAPLHSTPQQLFQGPVADAL